MLDGAAVVSRLAARRRSGAGRDDLLRDAVEAIEAASERYDWVGVYLLEGDQLHLHNYIGEATEHTRISVGSGVCGTAVAENRDINVPDVRVLDNYIACSLHTRSEIVVLIRERDNERIVGQLDLDSDHEAAFSERDELELKIVADWLGGLFGGDADA